MAAEEEEGEVDSVVVEAEEEDTVAKCEGATRTPRSPVGAPHSPVEAIHSPVVPPHPSTEFVPLAKCSSVWLFSVNVLLFPYLSRSRCMCLTHACPCVVATANVVASPQKRVHCDVLLLGAC